jgi:hypothetical protein
MPAQSQVLFGAAGPLGAKEEKYGFQAVFSSDIDSIIQQALFAQTGRWRPEKSIPESGRRTGGGRKIGLSGSASGLSGDRVLVSGQDPRRSLFAYHL